MKPRKLFSDPLHLAVVEAHSLQTWEAQIEKKCTFPDVCKPCTGVFWPVTLGPKCFYISHIEHIFYHIFYVDLGRVHLLKSGLARKWLSNSQGSEAKTTAISWSLHQ